MTEPVAPRAGRGWLGAGLLFLTIALVVLWAGSRAPKPNAPPSGAPSVVVSAPRSPRITPSRAPLPAAEETSEPSSPAPTSFLRGRVTTTGGAPLPGAAITLSRWDEPLGEAVADQDGRFAVLVDPGPVDLEASAKGFASRTRSAVAPVPDDVSIDLRLPRAATLSGRVVRDDTGEGVEGATVTAEVAEFDRSGSADTKTDPTGAFRFEALEGTATTIAAEARGLHAAPLHVILRPGETKAGLVLRAQRAATVRGRLDVVKRSGETGPCPDGDIILSSSVWSRRFAAVGEDGRWEFEGLRAGRYDVAVSCTSFAHYERVAPLVVDQTDREMVLVAHERRRLTGTVSTRLGVGIPEMMLFAQPDPTNEVRATASSSSDLEGAFSLVGLVPGGYTVFVEEFQAATTRHIVIGDAAPDAAVDFVIDRQDLRGRLLDREGRPVAEAWVKLNGVSREGERQLIEITDDAGRFTFTFAPEAAGASRASLSIDLFGRPLTVDGGDQLQLPLSTEATFVVDVATGVLSGDVLDVAGKPMEDAMVDASCEDFQASTRTEETGHFTFSHVPSSARCDVTARNQAGESGETKGARPEQRIVLSLRPAGVLRGVLANGGAPFVLRYGGPVAGSSTFPGPSGAWELRLPPGDYDVDAQTDGQRGRAETKLAAGQTRTLVIPLSPEESGEDD